MPYEHCLARTLRPRDWRRLAGAWCVAVVLVAGTTVAATDEANVARALCAQLVGTNMTLRADASRRLLALGPSAIAPLLDCFNEGSPADRAAIDTLLPAFGPAALPALCLAGRRDRGGSRYPDQYIMWNEAVRTATRMGASAIPQLVTMLQGRNLDEQTFAMWTLPKMGDPVVEPMSGLLMATNLDVRREAARILSEIASPHARPALLLGSRNVDATVRYYCTLGVNRLADRTLSDRLLELLRDDDGSTRAAAAGGLQRIYEPRFRLPLARVACCDSVVLTRDTAASALSALADPKARRLGYRYKAFSISPANEVAIALAYLLFYGVTGAVLLVLGAVATWGASAGSATRRVVAACAATGLAGAAWGGYLQHVVWAAELCLLLIVVPLVAVSGLAVRALLRRFAAGSAWNWGAVIGAFYLGYAVGWLWLWGYLGV